VVHRADAAPGREIEQMREQEQSLRNEAAQRGRARAAAGAGARLRIRQPRLPAEANKELASAGLVQRLQQVVASASPNPNACQITAQTPTDMPSRNPSRA
jgi:general secretion pathway protein M